MPLDSHDNNIEDDTRTSPEDRHPFNDPGRVRRVTIVKPDEELTGQRATENRVTKCTQELDLDEILIPIRGRRNQAAFAEDDLFARWTSPTFATSDRATAPAYARNNWGDHLAAFRTLCSTRLLRFRRCHGRPPAMWTGWRLVAYFLATIGALYQCHFALPWYRVCLTFTLTGRRTKQSQRQARAEPKHTSKAVQKAAAPGGPVERVVRRGHARCFRG